MQPTIPSILPAHAKGEKLTGTIAQDDGRSAAHAGPALVITLRPSFGVERPQRAAPITHFGGWRACAGGLR